MNKETILRMEGVSKSFPGVHALQNVNFDLREGEVHCLLGENGAGKSTLIKILSGACSMDSGKIYMNGTLADIRNSLDARKLGISTIYQEMSLIPAMTVAENLFFGEELTNRVSILNRAKMEKRTTEVLQKLRVGIHPKAIVRELSTAQQQMVEIARSLIKQRKIIIMDEPTSSISEKDTRELFRIIRELRSQGVSVIYISHRLHEFEEIVDRVTILRDGKNVDSVWMKDVTNVNQLISKMVGRELSHVAKAPDRTKDETVLRVEGVRYKKVIKDAGFHLSKGEILGFAGLVGSGRTELMKLIFGSNRLEEGTIEVREKPVRIDSPKDAVRLGIGYLSEDRKNEGLILNMSIERNISLARLETVSHSLILSSRKERRQAEDYIQRLRVATSSRLKKVKLLSGGNQQKVVIAKWLVTDCDILIFDEPTRGIDVGARAEIYKWIEMLAEQGKSIIVVSSDLPEIFRISNRVIVMSDGKITGELRNDDDLTQEKIMKLMVGG
jgi:ribose transport system ATP-binding protein